MAKPERDRGECSRALRTGSELPCLVRTLVKFVPSFLSPVSALLMTACAVGPSYSPVAPESPESWAAIATTDSKENLAGTIAVDDAAALERWWTWFDDPVLNELIETALVQSMDARTARARLRLARGERRAAQAGFGPQIGTGVSSERQQNPLPGVAPGLTFSLYEVGFDARWELDLFGRQRRRVDAATARVEASGEHARAVMTVLCAEVARSYQELRSAKVQTTLAHKAIVLATESARLSARLAEAGIVAQDVVYRSASRVAELRAELAPRKLAQITAQRQIERLLGLAAGALDLALSAPGTATPSLVPRLLLTPAAVLRTRPDIQRAEREVAAATALKSAAIADLYPRVSIAMFFGWRNTALSALASMASKSWSSGGSLLQPLFDSGRLRAVVDMRDAEIDLAVIELERSMLEALHETELALARWLASEHERDALAESMAGRHAALSLARHRRQQGMGSEQDVIAAAQAVNQASAALRLSEAAVTVNTIAVFKALGVGVTRKMAEASWAKTASNAPAEQMRW